MKNMRGLLIGLAAVLLVLVAVSQITTRQRMATVEGGGFMDLLPADFDREAVQTVVAYIGSAPDSTVELRREGDGWVVPTAWSWPARDMLVDRLFNDLVELNAEVRSQDESVLADYEIGDDEGLHVIGKGSGGSEIFHLVAGKSAERGGSFVREEGSPAVGITKKTLRSHFGIWADAKAPEAQRWLDLQIHRADRQAVDRIELETGEDRIVLEKAFATVETAEGDTTAAPTPAPDRSTWTWKPDAEGAFDKAQADAVLSSLVSLNAAAPADPDSVGAYGLEPPSHRATLTMQDGTSTAIAFGNVVPSDSTRVYVRVQEGKPAVIVKNTRDRIFKSREELAPTEDG